LLERFMKEIAKFDCLVNSKEFKIFTREKGDIEKILNALLRQTPIQILEKYRTNFKIEEEQDANAMQRYKETILDFQVFIKKVTSVMEIQKKQLKEMIKIREEQDKNYATIMGSIMRYEDQNVEYYSDSDLTKRILTHPSAGDLKERIDVTTRSWKNPYKDMYIWLKGELLDIKGISDAIIGRESVVKQ
jgi:TRAP-type mannitol/chloroaromatic compound transport system substrate-binding protein